MKTRSVCLSNFLLAFIFAAMTLGSARSCQAQTAVLSEIYGRGVHAYNAAHYDRAVKWLSMAIDNGFDDPRAYYFRGLATAASGRGYEASDDFETGAQIEAQGAYGDSVGRALSRVQGSTRLQLEVIRENARLSALAKKHARSQARYGELESSAKAGAAPDQAAPKKNTVPQAAPPNDAAAQPKQPAPPRSVTPPATPEADDPFADDLDQDPVVESDDVLKGAMENAITGDEAAPTETGEAPGGSSPFDAPEGGNDPFAPAGGGNDPFAPSGGDSDDPFGGF